MKLKTVHDGCRRAALSVALCFAVLAIAPLLAIRAASGEPVIEAVRLGEHPGKLRLVLETSEELAYRTFTLADPYRVVIDFPRFRWQGPDAVALPRNGLVTALRYGAFAPTTSRVVLDLARPVVIERAFHLAARDDRSPRFVLDMLEVDRQAYRAMRRQAPLVSGGAAPGPVESMANLTPPRRPRDSRPMIVIDAGHGGIDPGALGYAGTYEKDLVLRYALALERALLDTGQFRVSQTRRDDRFISLRDRKVMAQRAGAALFVSLHANTHASRKIRGAAVYTLSEKASDKEAARLAASENAVDSLAGVDLAVQSDEVMDILIDLARRETMNLSNRFAETLIDEVGAVAPMLRNSHRSAGFAVLKSPSVPSVLFEIGYISHPKEERLLKDRAHRRKLVAAMVASIAAHFRWQKSVSRL